MVFLEFEVFSVALFCIGNYFSEFVYEVSGREDLFVSILVVVGLEPIWAGFRSMFRVSMWRNLWPGLSLLRDSSFNGLLGSTS